MCDLLVIELVSLNIVREPSWHPVVSRIQLWIHGCFVFWFFADARSYYLTRRLMCDAYKLIIRIVWITVLGSILSPLIPSTIDKETVQFQFGFSNRTREIVFHGALRVNVHWTGAKNGNLRFSDISRSKIFLNFWFFNATVITLNIVTVENFLSLFIVCTRKFRKNASIIWHTNRSKLHMYFDAKKSHWDYFQISQKQGCNMSHITNIIIIIYSRSSPTEFVYIKK